jgi:acyl-CoA synthetase (AMP-forming)/AMP-acid ligase II
MVKVRGATVYPSEVETALATVPHIARAFVTDLPGAGGGREIGAAVIPDAPGSLTVDAVVAAARERLSAFKVPTVVAVLEPGADAPRSATGKVDKPALQQLLSAIREEGS